MSKDYYEILGVKKNATEAELKKSIPKKSYGISSGQKPG